MKAFLKNYRQAPRKVRLVASLIRGKSVPQAESLLKFLPKRAGEPIMKLMLSAVASAKQTGAEKENLFVKEIMVDKGIVMKRMMPAAMGTGHRINKRTSHIRIVLAEKVLSAKEMKKEKAKAAKEVKSEEKEEKKKVAKPKVVKEKKVKEVK